jgi:agmatinase
MIVKVPGINGLSKTRGCRNAGNIILESLDEIASNESGKLIDRKLLNLEEIHVDNENLEEQEKLIYENAKEIIGKNDRVIFLGGDHSISFPIGKAFLDLNKEKEPCLIVFDAHADCMIAGKNPSHEEWLRALVEQGFPDKNILLVGARNLWQDEIKFLAEKKIRKIGVNELMLDLEEVTDSIMEFSNGKNLYVSFDIDVVDPAFAPGTGYKEPGGLTARQAVYIVSRISRMKNLRVFDIVEVDEKKDYENSTGKLAAKLLAELL